MSEPDAYDAGFQARLGYIRVAPDGIVVDSGAIEHLTAGQVQMALSCFNSIHPCMTSSAARGMVGQLFEASSPASRRIREIEATIAQLEDALRYERRLSRRGIGQ